MAWRLLRDATSAPTADSSTAPTVKASPSAALARAEAVPSSGQKISATPSTPSTPPARKRGVSAVRHKTQAPSPASSGDAE
jgi:hypothetical protein